MHTKLNGVVAVLYWSGAGVEAATFLSIDNAWAACPEVAEFSAYDLAALDDRLRHFPR